MLLLLSKKKMTSERLSDKIKAERHHVDVALFPLVKYGILIKDSDENYSINRKFNGYSILMLKIGKRMLLMSDYSLYLNCY